MAANELRENIFVENHHVNNKVLYTVPPPGQDSQSNIGMSHQSRKPQTRKHHFRTHHSRNGQNSERLISGRYNFRNEISMGRIIFGKS